MQVPLPQRARGLFPGNVWKTWQVSLTVPGESAGSSRRLSDQVRDEQPPQLRPRFPEPPVSLAKASPTPSPRPTRFARQSAAAPLRATFRSALRSPQACQPRRLTRPLSLPGRSLLVSSQLSASAGKSLPAPLRTFPSSWFRGQVPSTWRPPSRAPRSRGRGKVPPRASAALLRRRGAVPVLVRLSGTRARPGCQGSFRAFRPLGLERPGRAQGRRLSALSAAGLGHSWSALSPTVAPVRTSGLPVPKPPDPRRRKGGGRELGMRRHWSGTACCAHPGLGFRMNRDVNAFSTLASP